MSTSHSPLERLNFVNTNPALKEHQCQKQVLETCKPYEKYDR